MTLDFWGYIKAYIIQRNIYLEKIIMTLFIVEQQSRSSLDKASIIAMTKEFLQKQRSFDNLPMSLHGSTDLNEVYAHINRINVSASGVLGGNHGSIFRNSPTKFYVYKLNHNGL